MKQLLLLSIIGICLSCGETPKLVGFDKVAWVSDQDGCKNQRLNQIDTILSQKEQLKGLSENQVSQILGKPDQHELYERSQKFFIYHLEAGNNCSNFSGEYFKALYIRFNSLDQAVAFTVQEIK